MIKGEVTVHYILACSMLDITEPMEFINVSEITQKIHEGKFRLVGTTDMFIRLSNASLHQIIVDTLDLATVNLGLG